MRKLGFRLKIDHSIVTMVKFIKTLHIVLIFKKQMLQIKL